MTGVHARLQDSARGVEAAPRSVTLEEFLAWPETTQPTEIVEGLLVVTPTPTGRHQRMVFAIARALERGCPEGYVVMLSPWDWLVDEHPVKPLVRQPDVVVVTEAQSRQARLGPSDVPLLAVEVLSPDSVERDLVHKAREYGRAGVRLYLVGDPERVMLRLFRRSEQGLLEQAEVAEGNAPLALPEPFGVSLVPSRLV